MEIETSSSWPPPDLNRRQHLSSLLLAQDAITRHGQMGSDRARLGKVMRSAADRNRSKLALPCFLEKPATPPVDRTSSENMLDHAHVNTPVIELLPV